MRDGKHFRKGNSQGEEEKSQLEKMREEMKNGLFGVFYIILKRSSTDLWKYAILMVLEYL